MKVGLLKWGAAVLGIAGAIPLVLLARRHPPDEAIPTAARPAALGGTKKLVVLSPAALKKNPITTTGVVETKIAPDLQVVGSVTYDQDHFAVVGPLVPGRVVALKAAVGDPVKAGQVLAIVESAEVGEAQADLLSARARAGAAEKNALREEELAKRKISSEREREVAEAQAASESAEVRAAVERLRAFGVGTVDVEALQSGKGGGAGRVPLRAPIDGTVVSRKVTLGQAVERATDAFEVANLGKLWVLLDLYEKDLRNVHVGQDVELRSDGAPGEVFRARVGYVNPLIDERTRTAGVRIEIEHFDGRLRPGQFVTARLVGDQRHAPDDVLAVPRKAVQSVDGKSILFRRAGAGFEAVPVEIGASSGELVEIRSGVVAGDEVAVEGAFLLKSELLR
ncbi:MAG TPA: efflux RND transporter periplasmic adaptor subunit [Polyangiaceae bacterium]|nr:efflux RND transporter periplasmic adaptor subunit [Polyangiaceae bacterium]